MNGQRRHHQIGLQGCAIHILSLMGECSKHGNVFLENIFEHILTSTTVRISQGIKTDSGVKNERISEYLNARDM